MTEMARTPFVNKKNKIKKNKISQDVPYLPYDVKCVGLVLKHNVIMDFSCNLMKCCQGALE